MSFGAFLWNPVAAIIFGYALLLIALAFAVHPMRRRLVAIGEEVIADPDCTLEDREQATRLVDTCMSFRVGLVLPIAAVAVLIDLLMKRAAAYEHGPTDPRVHHMLLRYFASVLAANPIFAALAIPLMLLAYVVARAKGSMKARQAAEEPVFRAADTAVPA